MIQYYNSVQSIILGIPTKLFNGFLCILSIYVSLERKARYWVTFPKGRKLLVAMEKDGAPYQLEYKPLTIAEKLRRLTKQ